MKNIETLNTIISHFDEIAAAARENRFRDTSIPCHKAVVAAEEIEGLYNRRLLVRLTNRVQIAARQEPEALADFAVYARNHIIHDLMPELQQIPS